MKLFDFFKGEKKKNQQEINIGHSQQMMMK